MKGVSSLFAAFLAFERRLQNKNATTAAMAMDPAIAMPIPIAEPVLIPELDELRVFAGDV